MTTLHVSARTLSFLFVLSMLAFVAVPATAQSGFLKIEGIDGEATSGDHRGWIAIESLSYAWEKPDGGATGQSRRRGSVTYGDMMVVKEIDASTPLLIDALSRGIAKPSASIDVMRGNTIVLKYELTNVAITSHSMREGREHVSLSFESIKITHPASRREATVTTSSRL